MALGAGAAQEVRPAAVSYTHLGVFKEGATRVGDKVYASSELAERWGWRVRMGLEEADIQAEGRRIRVPVQRFSAGQRFSLGEALMQLGATTEWVGDSTLRVTGTIRNVILSGGQLRLDATLAGQYRAFSLQDPDRLVLDFKGVSLPKSPLNLPGGVRIGQFAEDTVRLVVAVSPGAKISLPDPGAGRSVALSTPWLETPLVPPPIIPAAQALEDPPTDMASVDGQTEPPVIEAQPPSGSVPLTVAIGNVALQGSRRDQITLRVSLSGLPLSPASIRYREPTLLEIVLPGVACGEAGPIDIGPSDLIASVRREPLEAGGTVILVQTKRALAYEFAATPQAVLVTLVRPRVSDGQLAGKLIVVDAGHGGSDSGATRGGVMEKTVALQTARRIASELTREGANVVMTRTDDRRIPLNERPAIANRVRADLFISVHYNSNRVDNSASGTKTFFHRQNAVGRLLAQCIHRELVKVNDLPDMGVWSDTRIYQSGFAVLRQSTMPAVLLELAFVNHSRDRSLMVRPEWQQRNAEAVVRGIKVFLDDNEP